MMMRLILHIYERLRTNARLRWTSLVVLTAVCGLLITGQTYHEDISDFLPMDDGQQQAFRSYQNSASARRICVIVKGTAPQSETAVELLCELLDKADTAQVLNYMTADDPEVVQEGMKALYARIPYVLTAADYARIDSMTATPDFISRQLEHDKQLLMLPIC